MEISAARAAEPLVDELDELQGMLDQVQRILDSNLIVSGGNIKINDPVSNNIKFDFDKCAMTLADTNQIMKAFKGVIKDKVDAIKAQITAL